MPIREWFDAMESEARWTTPYDDVAVFQPNTPRAVCAPQAAEQEYGR